MKLRREGMTLFDLNYGDLVRPDFRIVSGRGWGQCTNRSNEFLVVYGPKHNDERSIFDTSPYVLPPGSTTPDGWDCDGFLLPSDRAIRDWRGRLRSGPLAVKFWNFRRFAVRSVEPETYESSWNNGVFQPSEINWAIPILVYGEIRRRSERNGIITDPL